MPQRIGVLLADDHSLTCVAIRALVGSEEDLILLGEAASFEEAQRLCQELRPDVLLLAANIEPASIKLPSSLHDSFLETRIQLLTTDCDSLDLRELVAAGAAGCVLKDDIAEAIVLAVRSAAKGSIWFSQIIDQQLQLQSDANLPPSNKDERLTEREVEVLLLVARGFSNRKIANELGIVERTASFHVSNILHKLGVASRVEAAVWAKEHSLA